MEGAPELPEEKPKIEINDDNQELADPRFTFRKGFKPPTRKPKPLTARERWEAAAEAADRRRASQG